MNMQRVPIFDLKREYSRYSGEISSAVNKVLESGRFILGDEVDAFEEEIKAYLGAKHAISLASGTDSLFMALLSSGIGEGDEVITTPFTFIATAESIAYCRAKPVFADIDPGTYNIDISRIRNCITRKTKAILPVHLYGNPVDMDPLMDIARENNLVVIEDCAQSFGADYKGVKTGSIGNIGCFSFFPTKNLGCYGDGGLLVTDDDRAADNVRKLKNHGTTKRYVHPVIGYNSRLDEIQAAILRVKLKYLDNMNNKRISNAKLYNNIFSDSEEIVVPVEEAGSKHVYHQYTIKVSNRDRYYEELKELGIGAEIYYPVPVFMQESFQYLGYEKEDLHEAYKASNGLISLPIFPELKVSEIELVADTVKSIKKG